MSVRPLSVGAKRSKFDDPYFGPRSTKKSKILGNFFFHGYEQPPKILLRSESVMSCHLVELAWNHPKRRI